MSVIQIFLCCKRYIVDQEIYKIIHKSNKLFIFFLYICNARVNCEQRKQHVINHSMKYARYSINLSTIYIRRDDSL